MVNATRTIKDITGFFRDFVSSQDYSFKKGYLQQVRTDVKLIGLLILIFLAITTSDFVFILCLIVLGFGLAILSGVHMKKYVTRFYFVPFFSLIAVFPWAFLKEGKTLYSFYGLIITVEGAIYVGIFVLRVVACIGIVSLLLFTTRIPDLIYSLRKMRVPSLLIDIFVIVYRRTFTFIKELYDMLLGIESRTFVQKKRVKNAKKFIGNFMRRILVKNEDIYTAMRAKGFNGRFKVYAKTYEWKLHSVSYILLILLMVTVWVMVRL